MKLGTIKLQSLSLIYPDWSIEYTDDTIDGVIFGLKSNPNFSSYLSASVGAINRAFALIEERLLSGREKKTVDLRFVKKQWDGTVISLDGITDIYKINQVLINGVSTDYQMITDKTVKVSNTSQQSTVEIVYHKKIERISHLTGNSYEISLCGIEEFIPYFVKSELLGIENTEGEKSRKIFEEVLDRYEGDTDFSSHSETVYSLRRI